MRLRLLVGAGLCAVLAGCGSAPHAAAPTPSSDFAPFSSTPPAAVGSGLVCGAAADRVLGLSDTVDLGALGRGATVPRSALIREAITQYAASRTSSDRDRAAGLIVGQCAAYGFYVITYRACVQPRVTHGAAPTAAIKQCIAKRRWSVYTQQ